MKKFLKIIGIIFLIFIVLGVIGTLTGKSNKKLDIKNSLQEGYKQGEETLKKEPTVSKKTAILSGKDETGKVIVQEISVWENAGSGVNNVTNGTVPNNTKVDVLDSKTVEGVTFYQISSAVGKVDVLPTDPQLREKAKKEKPQSEWTVEADVGFPVKGWVTSDFITNLK